VELTWRRLNRSSLHRQMLLERQKGSVADAVGRLVVLQAQDPASPYLALAARLASFDPASLDAAYADRSLLRTTLLRITLHTVAAQDHPGFHNAMTETLMASRLHDRRYSETGLTPEAARALVPGLTDFLSEPRRPEAIMAHLEASSGCAPPRLWWALKTFAPVAHVPEAGPWSFHRDRAYQSAGSWAGPEVQDASLASLVHRYLGAFGPATAQDIGRFALLRMPLVRRGLAALDEDLVTHRGPDSRVYYDLAGAELPPEDAPAPVRFLPMWDSLLLAYTDSRRVVPDPWRRVVTRINGDVLPTVLVDGFVAGLWRPQGEGIEVTALGPLSEETWDRIEVEARGLKVLLTARDPAVYRGVFHWWTKGLPSAEVRVVARGD